MQTFSAKAFGHKTFGYKTFGREMRCSALLTNIFLLFPKIFLTLFLQKFYICHSAGVLIFLIS